MKIFIKAISLFMAAVMLFSLTACFDYSYIDETVDSIKTTDSVAEKKSTDNININLPIISTDSLDPFKAKSEINQNLTSIMYDSLFNVDNSFKAQPLMADSFELKGTTLSVKLKSGLKFSDLSPVTANDVVLSFDAAKKSQRYKNTLIGIKDAMATDSDTVVFTLERKYIDPCSLLTFPIAKNISKSGNGKTDIPIGSGRYILVQNENSGLYLTAFSARLGDFTPIYTNIGLVTATDQSSAASSFSLGHSNVLVDSFSNGNFQKYIGATNVVSLTNLVYLVCNNNNEILKNAGVKKAISIALNRDELVNYSFMGFAKATYSPFHSEYYKISEYDFSSMVFNTDFSNKMLDVLGYKDINKTYNFRHNDGKVMEFDLLVSKENPFKLSMAQLIKKQLKEVSIFVNIKSCSEKDFFKTLSSGKYDMYIGECKLTNNFDLSPFYDKNNSVSTGISRDTIAQKKYIDYLNGKIQIDEFLNAFYEDMPFIPLLFRSVGINSNLSMVVSGSGIVSDYYYNIDKWMTAND